MRIMVTGSTGFIGFHTAKLLLRQGYELRLLVRDAGKMRRLFGGPIDCVGGDMTERAAVAQAVRGCEGVVHCAAMVSTRAADQAQVYQVNLAGTRNVMEAALDAGAARIIHVSSVTALYNPQARRLHEDSPPGTVAAGYGRSKVACERHVRGLQARGFPLTITYPATVLGPESPTLTEAHRGLQTCLTRFVPAMGSGNQYVDVRDIAEVHLAILEGRARANRYVLGGHYIPWRQLAAVLAEVLGYRPRQLPLDATLLRWSGGALERLASALRVDLPFSREGLGYATRWVPMDNYRVEQHLGHMLRPLKMTFADTIRWMYQAGYLDRRQAGHLAGDGR